MAQFGEQFAATWGQNLAVWFKIVWKELLLNSLCTSQFSSPAVHLHLMEEV